MVPKNIQEPKIHAAVKDSHFTVLGFTTATGALACSAIIFAAKQLDPQWDTGMDPFCNFTGKEDNMETNMGNGKCFHLSQSAHSTINKLPSFVAVLKMAALHPNC